MLNGPLMEQAVIALPISKMEMTGKQGDDWQTRALAHAGWLLWLAVRKISRTMDSWVFTELAMCVVKRHEELCTFLGWISINHWPFVCHRESWLQQLLVLWYCSQRENRCQQRQKRKQTWKCINPEKTNVRPLPPNTHQTHSVSLYELQGTWQSGATHQAMASWATSLCSCWDYVPMSSCSPVRSRCPSQKPLSLTQGPSFLVASFSSYAVNFRSDLHS